MTDRRNPRHRVSGPGISGGLEHSGHCSACFGRWRCRCGVTASPALSGRSCRRLLSDSYPPLRSSPPRDVERYWGSVSVEHAAHDARSGCRVRGWAVARPGTRRSTVPLGVACLCHAGLYVGPPARCSTHVVVGTRRPGPGPAISVGRLEFRVIVASPTVALAPSTGEGWSRAQSILPPGGTAALLGGAGAGASDDAEDLGRRSAGAARTWLAPAPQALYKMLDMAGHAGDSWFPDRRRPHGHHRRRRARAGHRAATWSSCQHNARPPGHRQGVFANLFGRPAAR